jgi:hypothetical protein
MVTDTAMAILLVWRLMAALLKISIMACLVPSKQLVMDMSQMDLLQVDQLVTAIIQKRLVYVNFLKVCVIIVDVSWAAN